MSSGIRRGCTGVIYGFLAPVAQAVKIGATMQPIGRRLTIARSTCPVPIKLAALMCGAVVGDEAALHRELRASRLHGEWFRLTPEVQAWIDSNAVDPLWWAQQNPPREVRPQHQCNTVYDLNGEWPGWRESLLTLTH
jgi:hypothetical protein